MIRAALLALLLAGCDTRAKEWTGWVYPNRADLRFSISLSGFGTFEECQNAAIAELRRQSAPDRGDYECGYMCRWDSLYRTNVCSETRK